jgi:hypothetical protein
MNSTCQPIGLGADPQTDEMQGVARGGQRLESVRVHRKCVAKVRRHLLEVQSNSRNIG